MTAGAGESGAVRLTMPRERRLRLGRDFRRVYGRRASAATDTLVVYADANGLEINRLGVSVGRKHGSSVRRNRIKRLLREAFRLSQAKLPRGYDFVLIPRRAEALTLAALLKELPDLARQAAARAARKAK